MTRSWVANLFNSGRTPNSQNEVKMPTAELCFHPHHQVYASQPYPSYSNRPTARVKTESHVEVEWDEVPFVAPSAATSSVKSRAQAINRANASKQPVQTRGSHVLHEQNTAKSQRVIRALETIQPFSCDQIFAGPSPPETRWQQKYPPAANESLASNECSSPTASDSSFSWRTRGSANWKTNSTSSRGSTTGNKMSDDFLSNMATPLHQSNVGTPSISINQSRSSFSEVDRSPKGSQMSFSDSLPRLLAAHQSLDTQSGSFCEKKTEDKWNPWIPRVPVQSTVPRVLAVKQSHPLSPPARAMTTYTKLSNRSSKIEVDVKNLIIFKAKASADVVLLNQRQVEMEEMERKLMGMDENGAAVRGGGTQNFDRMQRRRASILSEQTNLIKC